MGSSPQSFPVFQLARANALKNEVKAMKHLVLIILIKGGFVRCGVIVDRCGVLVDCCGARRCGSFESFRILVTTSRCFSTLPFGVNQEPIRW